MEALGRATLGNLTVHNAFFDLGLPKLIPKNKTLTSLDNLRTALFSRAGDAFDLIYSNGVNHLRSERRHFERHNPKSQEYWGFLNEIAKAVYPASKTRSFHRFVDKFDLACQEHPEKMRGMAKALLFDLDENGNEVPNPKFQQSCNF